MGVPTFFKWLTTKWEKVILNCVEERFSITEDRSFVPANKCEPNPSGFEVDNLYLDMNGIIHPCSHPENGTQPATEEEMYLHVCTYIDRIMNCVRPRKLVYMAEDGVAPRAKMNQQRIRRFKAALERSRKREVYEDLKREFEAEGRSVLPMEDSWDHNVITPGTPFMERLTEVIQFYIMERQTHDQAWKNLVVVFSDAKVAGEGEHKIMDFIRSQRLAPGYDKNMVHCIYGMDADLIMLGLSTHEPNFYIIREEMLIENVAKCSICGGEGHWASDCRSENLDVKELDDELAAKGKRRVEVEVTELIYKPPIDGNGITVSSKEFTATWKPFQFISMPILKEYLYAEFEFKETPCFAGTTNKIDRERCIDDFILMCFFVGNDFLPHLPALSIHKGSIDQMLLLYVKQLPLLGDYLTVSGYINFDILTKFCNQMALIESGILKTDYESKQRRETQNKRNLERVESDRLQKAKSRAVEDSSCMGSCTTLSLDANEKAAAQLREFITKSAAHSNELANEVESVTRDMTHHEMQMYFKSQLNKRMKEHGTKNDDNSVPLGKGALHEYRPAYYWNKFHLEPNNMDDVEYIAMSSSRAYVEGLAWVLQYYTQGVVDWEWFYPYHYAPFMVDIVKYALTPSWRNPTVKFADNHYDPYLIVPKFVSRVSYPFKPFEQLLSVLPPDSSHALPPAYAKLMKDPNSLISDIFPSKFHEDPNGAKMSYQYVSLLPFVDAARLKIVAQELAVTLTDEEVARNSEGEEYIYIRGDHEVMSQLNDGKYQLYINDKSVVSFHSSNLYRISGAFTRDCRFINGEISWAQYNAQTGELKLVSPLGEEPYKAYGTFPWPTTVNCNVTIPYIYRMPDKKFHHCQKYKDVTVPPPTLVAGDLGAGDFDDKGRRTNRFNHRAAMRIIAQSLGSSGMMKQQEVDDYSGVRAQNVTEYGNMRYREYGDMCIGEAAPNSKIPKLC